MLAAHRLSFVNSFIDAGPTFFGWQGQRSTRIDYIEVLDQAMPPVRRCQVLRGAGARLQQVRAPHPVDHRPLLVEMAAAPLKFLPSRRRGAAWDNCAVSLRERFLIGVAERAREAS